MARTKLFWIIALSFFAVSCGGGSGAGDSSSNQTPTPLSSWGSPELLEMDNSSDAQYPQVAVDEIGIGISVWSQSDGTRQNIWANAYTPNLGWSGAELIEVDNLGDARSPQIDFDSRGNAIAVWFQSDGSQNSIWANRYDALSGWGTAELIESDFAFTNRDPQIAVSANGNAVVVWEQWDGSRDNVWANYFSIESGWGTAENLESMSNFESDLNPQVAIDEFGNAIAIWRQSDGTRYNIWANSYLVGTGWGSAELIETDNAGNAFNPVVAFNNGVAVAVWSQSAGSFDGSDDNIWSNNYILEIGWGIAKIIESENLGRASYPRADIDDDGNAIAVWQQYDGSNVNIWANNFSRNSGWGTAELLENVEGHAAPAEISIGGNGTAVATWAQFDGDFNSIMTNNYSPGKGWAGAVFIEENNSGHAYLPQIAVDSSGNAITVWFQSDGTRKNIWANRFQ